MRTLQNSVKGDADEHCVALPCSKEGMMNKWVAINLCTALCFAIGCQSVLPAIPCLIGAVILACIND